MSIHPTGIKCVPGLNPAFTRGKLSLPPSVLESANQDGNMGPGWGGRNTVQYNLLPSVTSSKHVQFKSAEALWTMDLYTYIGPCFEL